MPIDSELNGRKGEVDMTREEELKKEYKSKLSALS